MNVIQQIVDILQQYPEIRYEFRADAIRVLAPHGNGYEVALLTYPQPYYTVCLATWHMEFTDENEAIGTFLGGLSEDYRLEVTSRGGKDYLWRIQYQESYGWRSGSAVGIFQFKFWRRKRIRYLQNHIFATAKTNTFLEHLRDAARRELQPQRGHPKSDWRRVRDLHPNLDEAAVGEIVENVAGVYQLIDDICRRRLRQEHPKSDDLEVQTMMMTIARPGPRILESALVERMHLPSEERLQQVATIMVDKVLGRRL